MTLTIGRVSIVQNPSHLELAGDRLDMGGWFFGTDLNQAKVLREQLIGLEGNEDEPDIPVTWSFDAKVDGYYTIKSVAVSHIMGVAYEDFKFEYAMQLERVQGGFAAPLCEVATSIAVRTNAHSVTVPVGHVYIPSLSTFQSGYYASGVKVSSNDGRTSETGGLLAMRALPSSGSFLAQRFASLPADCYDGAVLIEQSVGGVWYPLVGDQIGSVVGNLLRINNGLLRLTYHTDGVISSQVYDSASAAWETTVTFQIVGGSTGTWRPNSAWRILRNSPESCVVQTAVHPAGGGVVGQLVTLRLDRGGVLCHISADGPYIVRETGTLNESIALEAIVATAATSLTGGIRQTTNDANGHRWMMTCPSAVTKDLVNGKLTIAAPGAPLVAQFGLGWEVGGSSASLRNVAADVADEYFAALGLRQRIVAR